MIKQLILLAIILYKRLISPFLGPHCRFYPTCSEYAYQAVAKYGALKGMLFATRRILKCHPFHPGGIDPIP